jgi:5'/3'-nucleotidase SurE
VIIRSRAVIALLAAPLLLAACGSDPPADDPTVLATAPATSSTTPAPRAAPAPAPPPAPTTRPLRILLTDDDGFDAGGITAVRSALQRAGHDVTLVAPESDQSGAGTDTGGSDDPHEEGPGVFSVDGTPVDSVRAGLAQMRREGRPPDLVVSGTNLGANSGTGFGRSGTVGAASAAVEAGVPAIAASTHDASDEDDCVPTADYVARAVTALSVGRPVLPPHVLLNVNYPGKRRATSVRVRPRLTAVRDGDRLDVKTSGPDDDVDLLDRGIATVTEVDIGGSAPSGSVERLRGVAP